VDFHRHGIGPSRSTAGYHRTNSFRHDRGSDGQDDRGFRRWGAVTQFGRATGRSGYVPQTRPVGRLQRTDPAAAAHGDFGTEISRFPLFPAGRPTPASSPSQPTPDDCPGPSIPDDSPCRAASAEFPGCSLGGTPTSRRRRKASHRPGPLRCSRISQLRPCRPAPLGCYRAGPFGCYQAGQLRFSGGEQIRSCRPGQLRCCRTGQLRCSRTGQPNSCRADQIGKTSPRVGQILCGDYTDGSPGQSQSSDAFPCAGRRLDGCIAHPSPADHHPARPTPSASLWLVDPSGGAQPSRDRRPMAPICPNPASDFPHSKNTITRPNQPPEKATEGRVG